MKKVIYTLVLMLISSGSFARDYYVDADSGGKNTGTKTDPFHSIGQAAAVMVPGDVCYIAEGDYYETVVPKNSGTKSNPITYLPLKSGSRVRISGLEEIPSNAWEKYKDHFFRTRIKLELDHENQVFSGNQMLLEARWPNSGNDLLIKHLSEMDVGTLPEKIVDHELPDLDWEGASVWIHAPKYWSNWTTKVLSHDQGSLDIENIAPYPEPRRHVAVKSAEYYLFGCLAALDTTNEWFYDAEEQYLYIFTADNAPPAHPIKVKKRLTGFDLRGISHTRIESLDLFATSILTDRNSGYLMFTDLNILHPYHSSETNQYYGTQGNKGVVIAGKNCVIKNSEIAFSSGCGVYMEGEYNLVFNCYIHDTDYIGSYASNINLRGKGNIISHCTLCRSGRAMIDYGGMQSALIQFCNMYHSGMLTRDTGLTYGNVIEGDGSEVRYNWMHDNLCEHVNMGLYYDHGTQNILSHHNLIWGVGFSGIHINHYAYFHEVYHNTVFAEESGFRSHWGNQYDADLYGSRFMNNVFDSPCYTNSGNHTWARNIPYHTDFTDQKYLNETSSCIDNAIPLPGINDIYTGVGPDIGAYEFKGEDWTVGHNFSKEPELDTTRIRSLYRNHLRNSAFEHEDHVIPWQTKGDFRIMSGNKGQNTLDTAFIRMGTSSMELIGDSEVSQKVVTLRPGSWYEFSSMVKTDWPDEIVVGVIHPDGREELGPVLESRSLLWHRVLFRFTTGEDQTEATVFVRRLTKGKSRAFVDDCGLIFIKDQTIE